MPRKPIRYTTIRELIDGGFSLSAYCSDTRCRHGAELDLHALERRLGPDFSTLHANLAPKLHCSKCGGKDVSLRINPPT